MGVGPLDPANERLKHDKKMLKVFAIITSVIFVLVVLGGLAARMSILDAVGNGLLAGLALSVYVWGTVDYIRNRKIGRLSRRRTLKLLLIASAVLSAILLAALAIVVAYPVSGVDLGIPPDVHFGVGEVIAVVIGVFFGSFLSILLLSLLAFGAIGVVSALTRIITPIVLVRVRGISGNSGWTDRALAWIYGIPDTLDTRTLTLGPPETQDEFPRRKFMQAVSWELILGTILAIYVAFNPLIVDNRSPDSLARLFGTLGLAAILVPLVMVPWFVYTGMNAKIKGMMKDFRLYDGIRARIFRSYIAVGTIVVFVRMFHPDTEIQSYVVGFGGYLTALVTTALMFTFIYFNYFDRELTKDIITSYDKLIR